MAFKCSADGFWMAAQSVPSDETFSAEMNSENVPNINYSPRDWRKGRDSTDRRFGCAPPPNVSEPTETTRRKCSAAAVIEETSIRAYLCVSERRVSTARRKPALVQRRIGSSVSRTCG